MSRRTALFLFRPRLSAAWLGAYIIVLAAVQAAVSLGWLGSTWPALLAAFIGGTGVALVDEHARRWALRAAPKARYR